MWRDDVRCTTSSCIFKIDIAVCIYRVRDQATLIFELVSRFTHYCLFSMIKYIYMHIYIYDPWYEHSRRRILSYSTAIRANKWQEIGERCVEYGEYIYIYNTCKKKSIVVASVLRFLDGLIRTDAKRSKVGPAVTMIDPLWCTSVLLDPRAFLYKHVLFFFSLNCFCVWIIVYIFGATFTTRHDVIRARVFEPANYSRKKKEKRIVQTNKFVPDNLC